MVFVYVPHRRRDAVEATPEESALLARLRAKGLAGEPLEAALAASGVDPERARRLARSYAVSARATLRFGLLSAVLGIGIAVLVASAKGPLREWLRRELPGWEWLAELLIPLLFIGFMVWRAAARRRTAGDAPTGATRADQIENKPIG